MPRRAPRKSKAPRTPPLRLTTESTLAAGGDAIARLEDGRIVFVQGAAPDETVDVRLVKDNKSFARATVVDVVEPGPARVEPRCPHYATCGGCTLQHVDHPAQVESKQAGLRDNLERIGKIDLDAVEVEAPWASPPYGYRSRARLVLDQEAVGFRAPKSHRVVDVRQCPVLEPALQDVLTTLRAARQTLPPPRREKGEAPEVSLVTTESAVLANFPRGAGRLASAVAKASGPEVRWGDDALADVEDGFGPLLASSRVFSQASRHGNRALLEHVAGLLPSDVEVALDLYSGNGNFTRLLEAKAARVEAFEGSREAVALARRVAGEQTRVRLGDVAGELSAYLEAGGGAGLVLLDPPRTGAEREVLQAILQLKAPVVYVSCNPATFARDAATLEAGGLRLRRIRGFDLYPQTGHFELVGSFEVAE